ncbi:MAG TPA: hypothetical protein VGQ36_22000 [Thermoanaerobaculia bacterium]|jgi:hypothetical protein|nr:hypothetical protein [Thermoanaerobaculia bacterium]
MKSIASITFLLLLAACASPTAVIDNRGFRCGPGQDIEVRAGLDDGSINNEVGGELKYLVEIANNSHNDVVVTSVTIEPGGERVYGVDSAYKVFDQLIAEGDAHLFEIPASDVWSRMHESVRPAPGRRVEFRVTIVLSNGDSYHCPFEALWR